MATDLQLLRNLSAVSAAHATRVPFEPTVVRFGPTPGVVSLMNRQRRGWGERGIEYRSLWTLAREWRLTFLSLGADEHGRYLVVAPLRQSER